MGSTNVEHSPLQRASNYENSITNDEKLLWEKLKKLVNLTSDGCYIVLRGKYSVVIAISYNKNGR